MGRDRTRLPGFNRSYEPPWRWSTTKSMDKNRWNRECLNKTGPCLFFVLKIGDTVITAIVQYPSFSFSCITHLDSSCRFPPPPHPTFKQGAKKYSLSIEAWGSSHKNRTPNSCMSNGQIYDVYIYIYMYIYIHIWWCLSLYNMYTTKCI